MGIYGRQGICGCMDMDIWIHEGVVLEYMAGRGYVDGYMDISMDMDIWIHEGVVWEYMAGRGYVWGSGEMNAADQLRI